MVPACGPSEPDAVITDEALTQIREAARQIADGTITIPDESSLGRDTNTIPPPETRPLDDLPTAKELDIELDETGRPYDVQLAWYDGTQPASEPLGAFHVAGGELHIMDGNALEVDPVGLFDGEATQVVFDVDRLDLFLLLAAIPPTPDQPSRSGTVGVRLDVPDADPVAEWQPFVFAYGTDGGVGGLTSGAITSGAADQPSYTESGEFFAEWDYQEDYYLGSHAAPDGNDVFIFANGFGDGAYPMSRGFDADGRLVSLVLPSLTFPWRLMVPDGEPPSEVTAREREYLECMSGQRAVTVDGTCLSDNGF